MSGFDDDVEKTERQLHGWCFRATVAQAQEIQKRCRALSKYAEWSRIDYQVREGRFDALSMAGVELCQKLTDLDIWMQNQALRIIEEVTKGEP